MASRSAQTSTVMKTKIHEMPPLPTDDESGDALIVAWRLRALNVFTIVATALVGIPVVTAAFTERWSRIDFVFAFVGWAPLFGAAVLRNRPVRHRRALLLLSGWVFAAGMLVRSGVVYNFRVLMIVMPVTMIILAGARSGLLTAVINLVFVIMALMGTDAGWFPQSAPLWGPGMAFDQTAMTIALGGSQVLLLAWFSQHLSTSIRREHQTSARLRAEAAERRRLEGEVIEASERERRTIGGELHDGVCQELTSVLLRNQRALIVVETENSAAAADLREAVESLSYAIGEVHGLSRALSPGRLSGRELGGAIEDLVRRSAETAEAAIVFAADGEGPPPDQQATLHLYRIAQEAITNAVRHSGANRIDVRLTRTPTGVVLRVDDDGHWRQPPANGGGLGLDTIRWRTTLIGGTVEIGPQPAGGTRVECRVLARQDETEAASET